VSLVALIWECMDLSRPPLVVGFELRSLADIEARPPHVRFTPESGHRETLLVCPLCAKRGHRPRRPKKGCLAPLRLEDRFNYDIPPLPAVGPSRLGTAVNSVVSPTRFAFGFFQFPIVAQSAKNCRERDDDYSDNAQAKSDTE
jgi:hypothetical protein